LHLGGADSFHLPLGNFFQARCYSRLTALQIQQIELGMTKKDQSYPEEKEIKDPRF